MAKRKVKVVCHCEHNHNVTEAFDEAWDQKLYDAKEMEEFHKALLHSAYFRALVTVALDPERDITYALSNATRLGYEAGRRSNETLRLEAMVGYGPPEDQQHDVRPTPLR